MFKENILLKVDSYKLSHFKQYPEGAEGMMSYIEARTGFRAVFFGIQAFIKEYLLTPFTFDDIEEAAEIAELHGEPFNRKGWEYILNTYNGYMPVKIKAVPEGTVLRNGNVQVTIECEDPKCFWVASYLETILLRAIWYPTTVATNSYECKQVIKDFLSLTSDNQEQIMFKLHDFGGRGVSSGESAMLGGMAHLINFMGTDTVEALVGCRRYYSENMAGFSIPAAEHSTITSWGKENEVDAYRNMLKQYGGKGKLVAVVSDSYDILNACKLWGTVLKDEVINMGGTLVVRPDSGDPATTVKAVVTTLAKYFGTTVNSKGYKVLPDCIRVIQGDGINKDTIHEILDTLEEVGFAADNVAFGMGGALLQQVNRDTFGYAMKCCAIKINGVWNDVYKEAVGKNSKRGRLTLIDTPSGPTTCKFEDVPHGARELLKVVYEVVDGVPITPNFLTFGEVRENTNK